ncbi:hypothetical protein GCM10009037_04740 [Halarchaeum grantii]|uniref:RecA-superfamily ATPase, KaiC/GvpD/RAD55 family n=1 Tax=Halarchaeum grantii TaxID=1193105 RepID=A0A830ES89_9EURY|nr:hypothetical protein [Halarchaeum grantii]GGL24298.1 hypothetical protein GCM10009037_04740 [Halarchaeum grantii]
MREGAYGFEGLPLADVEAGSSVLIAGPPHGGARTLALRMLAGAAEEGTVVVTTNRRAGRLAGDCERAGIAMDAERTAIIDCVGGEDADVSARVLPVSGPSDLTGIGMRFSDVHRSFERAGVDGVRTGVCSLSTLLSFGELQSVSRFVHTLVGRVDSVDGLGVFLVDPAMHDERALSTLSQFCSGRIDVREGEDGAEFRVRGLSGQSREWVGFDATLE